MASNYYANAQGVLLIYDCCDETSFNNIEKWIKSIQDNCQDNMIVVLVCNKIDNENDRVI